MTTLTPFPSSVPTRPVRVAATLIVLRDGASGMEVLMLRRAEKEADQNSGASVFPGGTLDAQDRALHALCNGIDVAFDIDWQGHRQLREILPEDVVGIFVLPPSLEVLEARLRARAGDDVAEIARRMSLARDEIEHWREFSHVIVNDDLEQAIAAVHTVLRAARLATSRRVGLDRFVAGL